MFDHDCRLAQFDHIRRNAFYRGLLLDNEICRLEADPSNDHCPFRDLICDLLKGCLVYELRDAFGL